MRHLFNNPLGSCAPPCAPSLKNDLLNSLVSGGASLLGSLVNAYMVADTNDTNKQIADNANIHNDYNVAATNKANKEIADEANKYNKLLQDEQNAWNLEQWNRENQYNSPSEQVKRLKEAGINPYALYGNSGVTGNASQLTSAPSQPAAVAQMQVGHPAVVPQMVAPQFGDFGTGAFNAARLSNAQVDKLGSDVQVQNAQEQREVEKHYDNMRYLKSLADGQGFVADMAREQLNYERVSQKYKLALLMGDIRTQSASYQNMLEQRSQIQLSNKLAEVQLAYAPKLNQAQLRQYYATISQIKAEIGLIGARADLTRQQKLTEIENYTTGILRNESLGLDNRAKNALFKTTIETAKENYYSIYLNNRFAPSSHLTPWLMMEKR